MSAKEIPPESISVENSSTEPTPDDREVTKPPAANLSLDVVFNILRNRRRRLVLQSIEEEEGTTTLSDLAEHIGGIENDKPPAALNAQERKRVYVGLYQCHLPKMDDAGAIEFDKNRGTVDRGPMVDTYHTYLEREVETRRQWAKYYGGLTGVSAAALVGSVVLSTGLTSTVFVVTLLTLAVLSAWHWSRTDGV